MEIKHLNRLSCHDLIFTSNWYIIQCCCKVINYFHNHQIFSPLFFMCIRVAHRREGTVSCQMAAAVALFREVSVIGWEQAHRRHGQRCYSLWGQCCPLCPLLSACAPCHFIPLGTACREATSHRLGNWHCRSQRSWQRTCLSSGFLHAQSGLHL